MTSAALVRRLILCLLAAAVGVGAGMMVNYHNSYGELKVEVASGLSVSVYKDLGGDAPFNYNAQSPPIMTLSAGTTVRLKQAVYDFVVANQDNQFANPVTKFNLSSPSAVISINPSFSQAKLASLLTSERQTIRQTLTRLYPALPSYYTFGPDALYEHGEWYGTSLTPLTSSYDQLHVILHESNNMWSTATSPQISISIPGNPSIPKDVIDSTDQL